MPYIARNTTYTSLPSKIYAYLYIYNFLKANSCQYSLWINSHLDIQQNNIFIHDIGYYHQGLIYWHQTKSDDDMLLFQALWLVFLVVLGLRINHSKFVTVLVHQNFKVLMMWSPAGYIKALYLSWFGLIQSKHTDKNCLSHTTSAKCHIADVSNHPAELLAMDLNSGPAWDNFGSQIFTGLLLFVLSVANKIQQIWFVCLFWFPMIGNALQSSYNSKLLS